MGKVNRRRTKTTAVAAAVIGIMSTSCAVASRRRRRRHHHQGAAASSSSSSSTAAHAAMTMTAITSESSSSSSLPLGTVFSCGSHWTKATTCSTLCPSGDDHQCPLGESCFAGIPCDTTTTGDDGEGASMEEILQHQSQLEQQEMNRLVEEREGMFVNRYVCGESYLEAEESCNDFDGEPSLSSSSLGEDGNSSSSSSGSMDDGFTTTADSTNGLSTAATATAAHYCPTGSSSQCPPTMKCYAAVSCPRHLHDPEPLLMMDQKMVVTQPTMISTLTLSPSSSATAPTTTSTPTEDDDGSRESSRMDDSWSSYIRESSLSSMVVSGISSLLSSSSSSCGGGPGYGLN